MNCITFVITSVAICGLASCSTPAEQCEVSVAAEQRNVSRLLQEVEANIAVVILFRIRQRAKQTSVFAPVASAAVTVGWVWVIPAATAGRKQRASGFRSILLPKCASEMPFKIALAPFLRKVRYSAFRALMGNHEGHLLDPDLMV